MKLKALILALTLTAASLVQATEPDCGRLIYQFGTVSYTDFQSYYWYNSVPTAREVDARLRSYNDSTRNYDLHSVSQSVTARLEPSGIMAAHTLMKAITPLSSTTAKPAP